MNWILGRSTKFRLVAVRNPTYSFTCRNEVEERHLERLVQVISAEGLLKAIKMYCDWMSCHPHIIATCAQVKVEVIVGFIQTDGDVQQERNECLGSPPPPPPRYQRSSKICNVGILSFTIHVPLLSTFLYYPLLSVFPLLSRKDLLEKNVALELLSTSIHLGNLQI